MLPHPRESTQRAMAGPGHPDYPQEVHLQQRNLGKVPQVNEAMVDPAYYSDSIAQAARGRQDQFLQQATAAVPYASRPEDCYGRFPPEVHLAPKNKEVVDKVNVTASVDLNAACSDQLAQIARGKQERFYQAATAQAPYAVLAPGATARVADSYPAEYVRRERRQEIMDKVGSQGFDPALYHSALESMEASRMDRFSRAAAAQAPFAVDQGPVDYADKWGPREDFHAKPRPSQEVMGKPGTEDFGNELYAATRYANQQGAASTRARNYGVPGLLRQDNRDGFDS